MKNLSLSVVLLFLTAFCLNGQLVITEISYNPPESLTDSLEYIELYNAGTSKINLYKYKFTSGIVFTFPNVSLDTGKYLIIAGNDLAFTRNYNKQALKWTDGALSNSGEVLTIVDSLNNPVISFEYKKAAPWPTSMEGTDGNGGSIEICNPLADPKVGENWKVSTKDLGFMINGKAIKGTPGEKNSIPPCAAQPSALVEVSSNVFTPKDITIETGQIVRWVNTGGSHNVNGKQSVYPSNPESFYSGDPSSDAWTFDFQFTKSGVYQYQCDPHASLGMKGTVTVKDPVMVDPYPQRSISQMTTTNSDGVLDSLNVNCTLTGIVYGVNLNPAGLQFFIIDGSNNGIGIFNSAENFGYTVKEGDQVTVQGQVVQFNGLAQMSPVTVSKKSENNTLLTPKVVTAFAENDESSFIEIRNVSFVDPSKWVAAGSGFNVSMTDGTKEFLVRIDKDIDAFAAPIPSGSAKWAVSGLLSQFDNTAPYTEGYQLLPRYLADFHPAGAVSDPGSRELLKVSPNPVNHLLTIQADQLPDEVILMDARGTEVSRQTGTQSVDMQNLPAGLYVVKARIGSKLLSARVVKL